MRHLTWIVLCMAGMGFAAAACSDDSEGASGAGGSGGAAAGAAGSAGTAGAAGKAGATNNGGSAGEAGASGGGGTTFPIQCPGGSPVCDDDNTAWTCTEFGPTMTPCGNTECKNGKCTCSNDEQCKREGDESWVECGCTDGQTVKKTTNEIAACDVGTGACVEYKMDTICKAVCKDNGGDGKLTDMHMGT